MRRALAVLIAFSCAEGLIFFAYIGHIVPAVLCWFGIILVATYLQRPGLE